MGWWVPLRVACVELFRISGRSGVFLRFHPGLRPKDGLDPGLVYFHAFSVEEGRRSLEPRSVCRALRPIRTALYVAMHGLPVPGRSWLRPWGRRGGGRRGRGGRGL